MIAAVTKSDLASRRILRRAAEAVAPSAARRRSEWLWRGFQVYLRNYLRKNFHQVGVSGAPPKIDRRTPLLVYGNHPSWWDPLLAMFAADKLFPDRAFYAPIDAAMLRKYRVLERLGVFGVDLDRPSSARTFISECCLLLEQPCASLWLTPQGRFCDVRHAAPFRPGLGMLAATMTQGVILPLAVEYNFWNESRPVALLRFGRAIDIAKEPTLSRADWTALLEQRLAAEQFMLAQESISRESEHFQTLLSGRSGVGGIYDQLRKFRAWFSGKRFSVQHDDVNS